MISLICILIVLIAIICISLYYDEEDYYDEENYYDE